MNQNKIIETIKEFGISELESQVYLSLLKNGVSNASLIASDLNIKRTTIYPILERLIEHGLVNSYDQNTKKVFAATKPNKLLLQYEKKLDSLSKIIPQLENIAKTDLGQILGVKFIQTKKELESIYNNILLEYKNKEYYIIGSSVTWLNLDEDFFIDFRKKRAKNNTKVKLILTKDSESAVGQDDPSLLREYKYLPAKVGFKSTIDIYHDKIIIVGPEVKALCAVIAIPPMVDVFRSIFEVLWEKLD
jgi:sugar-specific transcriptional regulator TrmB